MFGGIFGQLFGLIFGSSGEIEPVEVDTRLTFEAEEVRMVFYAVEQ